VKQLSKIGVAVRLLTLVALVIVASAAASRAQQPVTEKPPSASVQSPSSTPSGMQILTPTEGVNFGPYMNQVHAQVMKNWSASLPDEFRKGTQGLAIIRFDINRDGTTANISLEGTSGSDSLDQAAINAIRNSSPLTPLPPAFKGPRIAVRSAFYYNLQPSQPSQPSLTSLPSPPPLSDCSAPVTSTPLAPPFDRLELLAFLAGQNRALYEAQPICQRGIDFTPDPSFLAALRSFGASPALVGSLANFAPREIKQPSANRVNAYGLLDAALSDKRIKQVQSANENFVRALQLAPDSATLHLAYARNLLLQNYSEAEAQARQSLKLWPENAEAHVTLAFALSLQKRDSEATLEAREALRIFPGHENALAELGISLARSGQFKDAIPILQEAIPLAPELPMLHKLLGISLVHTGNSGAAIEELTLFLKTSPDDAQAHYFLGVALRDKGKRDEALAEFREAKRIEPSNPLYLAVVDPADAKEPAKAVSKPAGPQPDDSFFSDNVYTNTFFGFSYEFPKGWIVLKAGAGEAVARLGVSILANGDPTMPDIAEAAVRNSYQLLFVAKQTTKDVSVSSSSIHISAFDQKLLEPNQKSAEDFLRSMTAVSTHRGFPISVVSPPEQLAIDGKAFSSVKLNLTANGVVVHTVEAVTMEKGYVLLFVLTSFDTSTLDELVHTMQSLRFTDSSAPNNKP
jgi:TonB family protein